MKYRNHTLVISRPSKPEPVEEVKESVQPTFSLKDLNETPGGNATGHGQSITESATIAVSNIPKDMAEDTLQMIFENKRYGGGGDVKNIVYEKGQGSAVITFYDPEGKPFIYSFIHSCIHLFKLFVHSFIHLFFINSCSCLPTHSLTH